MAIVEPQPGVSRRELWSLALRWLIGLALLVGAMLVLASLFRSPLERLGRAFVDKFGYAGMAIGTFIADGFHFPIPPQFYMFVAVASHASRPLAFGAITLGSLLGGFAGYNLAARLARIDFVVKRLAPSRAAAERIFARFGYRAAVFATFLPVAYSVLCYVAGLNGLPRRVFAVLSLCRIPRLVFFFYLVELGWSLR